MRVEDYLAALASSTGEAALLDSRLFDVEQNDLVPGGAVFGDEVNRMLSGDVSDIGDAPSWSVAGCLRDRLIPDLIEASALPTLDDLYQLVAENVGSRPWGSVATTVGSDHEPRNLPLRAAFELRPVIDAVMRDLVGGQDGSPPGRRIPCAVALADAIRETAGAIEVAIGARLSLEITFGMAKMVPMSRRAMQGLRPGGPPTTG